MILVAEFMDVAYEKYVEKMKERAAEHARMQASMQEAALNILSIRSKHNLEDGRCSTRNSAFFDAHKNEYIIDYNGQTFYVSNAQPFVNVMDEIDKKINEISLYRSS